MATFRIIGGWLRFVVRRTPELFEFTSGVTTLLVVIVAWLRHSERVIPSISLIAEVMPEPAWFILAGGASVLQLIGLWLDDPGDGRHPAVKRTSWLRFCAASVVAAWYFILPLASASQVGLNHVQFLYGAFAFMNLYTMAHVSTRSRA